MKTAMTCFYLVLVALAVISPSACFPQGSMGKSESAKRDLSNDRLSQMRRYYAELQNAWEMQEDEDQDDTEDQGVEEEFEDEDFRELQNVWEMKSQAKHDENCIVNMCIMAFTSGLKHAESKDLPFVEISPKKGVQKKVAISGSSMTKNKGNIWEIPFENFGFEKCVKKCDIEEIRISSGGKDGWNVKSLVIIFLTKGESIQLLTADLEVNRWIDTDKKKPDRLEFPLTLR